MDGRDWYAVVRSGGPCPDCGFDAADPARGDLGPAILAEARRWDDLLARLAADEASLRRRPAPEEWSAIEYACHMGGVFEVFAGRVEQLRITDGVAFEVWDHDAAVLEERYAERPVADAVAAIGDGAVRLALALPRPEDAAAWARSGTREDKVFSVEGIARYGLHESVHHRDDAERAATAPAGGARS